MELFHLGSEVLSIETHWGTVKLFNCHCKLLVKTIICEELCRFGGCRNLMVGGEF